MVHATIMYWWGWLPHLQLVMGTVPLCMWTDHIPSFTYFLFGPIVLLGPLSSHAGHGSHPFNSWKWKLSYWWVIIDEWRSRMLIGPSQTAGLLPGLTSVHVSKDECHGTEALYSESCPICHSSEAEFSSETRRQAFFWSSNLHGHVTFLGFKRHTGFSKESETRFLNTESKEFQWSTPCWGRMSSCQSG